jgi:hypothetical protein
VEARLAVAHRRIKRILTPILARDLARNANEASIALHTAAHAVLVDADTATVAVVNALRHMATNTSKSSLATARKGAFVTLAPTAACKIRAWATQLHHAAVVNICAAAAWTALQLAPLAVETKKLVAVAASIAITDANSTAHRVTLHACEAVVANTAQLRALKLAIDAVEIACCACKLGVAMAELCCAVAETVARAWRRARAERNAAVHAREAVVAEAFACLRIALTVVAAGASGARTAAHITELAGPRVANLGRAAHAPASHN